MQIQTAPLLVRILSLCSSACSLVIVAIYLDIQFAVYFFLFLFVFILHSTRLGGLLGAKYGYSRLPRVWLEGILEKDYFAVHVNRLLVALGLMSEYEALQEMTAMMSASSTH